MCTGVLPNLFSVLHSKYYSGVGGGGGWHCLIRTLLLLLLLLLLPQTPSSHLNCYEEEEKSHTQRPCCGMKHSLNALQTSSVL